MDNDIEFMQRALVLAARGQRHVSPNPMVGCVIVKQGKIVGEGWHKIYGGDHAEVDALKKAGARAKGSSMYVTLEPCSHWGKTPPCVDAVIAAGLKRVIVAMQDPDPRTNGRSIRRMRAQGIEVLTGVCEAEARALNAAFIKYVVKKMPYVTAKTAQTIDGKVGTLSGKIKWITSSTTRTRSKARRDEFDAIMVGVSTVLADDPCLCAPGKVIKKIIVDSLFRMPLNARLFKDALSGQVIIAVTDKAPVSKIAQARRKGAEVLLFPFKQGHVDLKALFKALAKKGIQRILVEGGPTLANMSLALGLVDRMHVYIAPRRMTGVPREDMVAGVDVGRLINEDKLDIVDVKRIHRDIFIDARVYASLRRS